MKAFNDLSINTRPLDFEKPRRVQIVRGSGGRNPYFKVGQRAYVIAQDDRGGMWMVDEGGDSDPGECAYLVSKTKDMKGGALWFSEHGVRFTKRRAGGVS